MILIQKLTLDNLHDAGRCDRAFRVETRLVLSAENSRVSYTVASTAPYEKRYLEENIDYAAYIGNPDKAVYLACVDGQVAGQIRLRRWLNR